MSNSQLYCVIACALCTGAVTAVSARAGDVGLVEDGVVRCSIVLRPRPAALAGIKGKPKDRRLAALARDYADEQAAAEDLARVVKRMTGAAPAVATAPVAGLTPIYIGEAGRAVVPDLAEQLRHPDPLALANDRYLVQVGRRGIVLAGAGAWATRLAVTQFLEDRGCRWYGGGAFFEVIPPRPRLTAAVGRHIYTPDFEMRDVWYVADADLAHLKLQRHDAVLNHGHSWHQWIGVERKARPELRGLVQGERKGPLEYTHPDVPDIFVKNINAFIEKTGQRTVSLSTDDGPVYSESKESSRWLLRELANPFMATPAISDAVMRLFKRVIPRVIEKHPRTVFGFLVYANTMTPPRYESVPPELAVVGAPLAENPLVPTTSQTDPRRQHFRRCFETWMKLARRGYVYEYDPFVVWHGVMAPRVELIRRNIPYYKSIGVRGMNIESRQSQFSESGLNLLVYSRLFWNTSADVDAILDEFADTFYGPASGPIREWIRVTQTSILTPVAPVFGNEDHNIELIYTSAVMKRAGKALKKGEKLAREEPWRTRVRAVRLAHDQIGAYLESKSAMDACEFRRAVAAIDRMYAIKNELQAIDPALAKPDRWDLKVEGPPWLRGLRKQATVWAALAGDPVGDDAPAGKLIARLPEAWTFAFDPENLGMSNAWEKRKKLPGAERIDIGQPWDYQGHAEPRIANGWYRTDIKVPGAYAGKPVHLLFTRLYGMKITLYLDGQRVEHRDLPRYFWFDYHHEQEFDLTPFIRPRRHQVLTVRVFKEFDWGGPYGGVFLFSPADPARKLMGRKD